MGALGDSYVTLPEMKNYTSVPGVNNKLDELLQDSIDSATTDINLHCDRQFNRSEDATPRVFESKSSTSIRVDDFWTTDGLIIEIDTRGDQSFSTVLSPSDYQLHPLNGVVAGEEGWPFNRIKLKRYSAYLFGSWCSGFANVRVTAKWGWEAVPANVKTATFLLANETFAAKGAPLGVAGSNAFGDIRVRQGTLWSQKLIKYVRTELLVG